MQNSQKYTCIYVVTYVVTEIYIHIYFDVQFMKEQVLIVIHVRSIVGYASNFQSVIS